MPASPPAGHNSPYNMRWDSHRILQRQEGSWGRGLAPKSTAATSAIERRPTDLPCYCYCWRKIPLLCCHMLSPPSVHLLPSISQTRKSAAQSFSGLLRRSERRDLLTHTPLASPRSAAVREHARRPTIHAPAAQSVSGLLLRFARLPSISSRQSSKQE